MGSSVSVIAVMCLQFVSVAAFQTVVGGERMDDAVGSCNGKSQPHHWSHPTISIFGFPPRPA